MKQVAVFLIDIYSSFFSLDRGVLSLLVPGGACRYYPTCSQYTKISILKYGLKKGTVLGIRRFLSCR